MREDSQLHRVALSQQVLLLDLWPLHIHLDVHVGSYVGGALGLNHNGADVINQDGRARDLVPRLEVPQQVCWSVLVAADLQRTASIPLMSQASC